jgi:hypothetical protein
MELIESHLNEAISFINERLQIKTEEERNKWCHILSNDMLKLDEIGGKKEIIIAIQNVLDQLDNLFETEKPPMLISNIPKVRAYLPDHNNSFYAVGSAFQT